MITDSNPRNAVPLADAKDLICLSDSENYKKLDEKRQFFLRYQYFLVIVPFILAMLIGLGVLPRIVPDTAFWAGVAETLIVASLGWAGIVIFCASFIYLRWFIFRCPRCGWR